MNNPTVGYDESIDDLSYDYEYFDFEVSSSFQEMNDDVPVEPTEIKNIREQLCQWSQENNISNTALTALLKVLKPHLPTLRFDARTLLSTPREKIIKKIVLPGEYYHLGLEKAVKYLLAIHQNTINFSEYRTCEILVNVDGLPISKSSGSQLYPILISLYPLRNSVALVGLYHEYKKPQDPNSFLQDFVT